jgi:protocatechuate 3,4-dioxygenase beta subunit
LVEAPLLGWFAASSSGWTTVLSSELGLAKDGEPLLVVAPSRLLRGMVVDGEGRALPGVEVRLAVAPRHLHALGEVPSLASPIPRKVATDGEGAFAFEDAPLGDLVLEAWKEGYRHRIAEVEQPSKQDAPHEPLRIVLQQDALPAVRGIVTDASGQPVEGAFVSAGQGIGRTDAAGSFLVTFDPEHWSIRGPKPPRSICVRAVHKGLGMAQQEIALPPAGTSVFVELLLAGEPLSIAGRVVDLQGAPVSSVEVFVAEETPFGFSRLESLGVVRRCTLESMLGAQSAWTSADGSFRIDGLADRAYRLQALQATSLQSSISDDIQAGSRGVRLTLDLDARGPLEGRILDRRGVPVEGARVSVSCRQRWGGPADTDFDLAIGAASESDSEGRFSLKDVARENVFLRLEGESIVPEIFRGIDPAADPSALELSVERRSTLQVHWGDWRERADRLHLEDGDGNRLGFADLSGSGVTPLEWIAVGTGLSSPMAVPDRAAHAVLTRDGKEALRVRLQLLAGELERLQL